MDIKQVRAKITIFSTFRGQLEHATKVKYKYYAGCRGLRVPVSTACVAVT
jgi:hypothetical protein